MTEILAGMLCNACGTGIHHTQRLCRSCDRDKAPEWLVEPETLPAKRMRKRHVSEYDGSVGEEAELWMDLTAP
jgi:hypothetical protein